MNHHQTLNKLEYKKVQKKRKILYNIRPANWVAERAQYQPFDDKDTFVNALFDTKVQYSGVDKRGEFLKALQAYNHRVSSDE